MLETPHVIVAAAIAAKIPNPAVSLPLALASHFLLDITPHWNPHLNRETMEFGKPTRRSTAIVIIDSSLALFSGLAIASSTLPNLASFFTIVIACFLSVLPDLVESPYFFLGARSSVVLTKWIAFQKSIQNDAPIFWGLLVQGIVTLAGLFWLFA